jgi:hypothetical protein
VLQEKKVSFMRSYAPGIDRLLVRSLPLALVLGLLGAMLCGLVGPHGQVAHADNPSVNIVSPSSAQGPVQTGIRVVGAGWNQGAMVQVFYNKSAPNLPCGDPANSQALAQATPIPGFAAPLNLGQNTTWTIDFQWPSTTGIGQFYICAFDTTTPMQVTPSSQPFNVLSTALPAITVDKQFPNVGDQITVSGQGFLPGNQPVDLLLTQPDQQTGTKLGTVTVGNDGSFTQQVTLPASPSGQLDVVAVSRTPVRGALPPLIAKAQVTVGPTPSTPTPGPSPTPTPDPTATATPTTSTVGSAPPTSKSSLILTALIALLVLVILAIFGVMIWYVAGTRPPAGVGAPGGPPPPLRARAPVAPRRTQDSWQSLPDWQAEDDEWEGQQGPWEEDSQGGWNDLPTQWSNEVNPWPQGQGPGAPPSWSGPAGRGNAGAPRPAPPREPDRDDWQGRARPGQDDC